MHINKKYKIQTGAVTKGMMTPEITERNDTHENVQRAFNGYSNRKLQCSMLDADTLLRYIIFQRQEAT